MANNLFADVPAACVAKQTIDFATAGFDSTNTRIIYEVGSPLKSFVPGRSINAVTGFTTDKGYYIVPKLDMDKTAYLAPPIAGGGGGGTDPALTTTGAWADAVGATTTERSAALTFTQNGLDNGWYSKLVSLHPLVGTSEILKRRNMLDPSDSDGAFRLVVLGGTPTSIPEGISLGDNFTDKYQIPMDPTLITGQPNIGVGVYFNSTADTKWQIYNNSVLAGANNIYLIGYESGDIWAGIGNASGGDEKSSTNTYDKDIFVQRIDTATLEIWNGATLLGSPARANSGITAGEPIALLGRDNGGTRLKIGALYVCKKMTSAERIAFANALSTFMTAVGH